METKQAVPNTPHGFTMIEMLIFVSVTSMVFIVMLGVINYATINIKQSQYKVIATHFGEELLEWFRYQRDKDGFTAVYNLASAQGKVYCFNETSITTWPAEGACSGYTLKNFYKRQITLKSETITVPDGSFEQLDAVVVTGWKLFDLARSSTIELRTTNN